MDKPKDELKDQVKDEAKDTAAVEPRHLLWKSGRPSALRILYDGDEALATLHTYGRDPYAEFVTSFGKFIIKAHDLSDRLLTIEDVEGNTIVNLRRELFGSGNLTFADKEMAVRLQANRVLLAAKAYDMHFEDIHGNLLVSFGTDGNHLTVHTVDVFLSSLSIPKQMLLIGLGEYIWISSHASLRFGPV